MADNQQKYNIVLNGVNKLSAPLASAGDAVRKLESDTTNTNNELKTLNDRQKSIGSYQLAQTTLKKTNAEMNSLSVSSSKLSSELKQSKLALDSNGKELLNAQVNLARLSSEMAVSDKVTKAQRGEFKAAEKQVKDLKKAYNDQEKTVNDLTNALRRNDNQLSKTTNKLGKQSDELGKLGADLKRVGINTDSLGDEQKRLAKSTERATASLVKQKSTLKELRAIDARKKVRSNERGELAGQAMGTAMAAMPLAAVGNRAVDYQSAFLDVKKVVSFNSEQEEKQFKSQMKRLAVETGMGQIGMAEIVASAGKSGIGSDKNKSTEENQKELLTFARDASEMAVAFGIDAGKAGETLATFQASMGLEGDKALALAKTSNLLADNLANTDPKQIASILAREGATAMSSGLSANDTAALAGSLFAADGSEERSATALKGITGALTKGFAATGSQKNAYSMIGLDANDVAAGMQSDSRGTILEVFTALKEADDVDRSALISQLFGEEAKGAVTKLIKSMDGDKGLVATLKLAEKTSKSAAEWEKELAGRRSSSQYLIDQSMSSLDRLVTAVGSGFIPIIEFAAPKITMVADELASLIEQTPELATGVAVLTTGLIAAKTAAIGLKLGKNLFGASKDLISQKKLSSSVLSTKNAADNASRSVDRLNNKLNNLGGSTNTAGGDRGRRKSKRRSRKSSRGGSRRRMGGKWGRRLGLLGGATAMTLMPGMANAADTLTMGGDLVDGMAGVGGVMSKGGAMAGVGGMLGKVARPLGILVSSLKLVDSIENGDAKQVGGDAGDLVGGLGGAAAGAAIGTMLLPGIGTAIGGMIGGLAGGEAGGWLGEQIGALFSENRTDEPAKGAEKKQLDTIKEQKTPKQYKQEIKVQVALSPTGDANYDAKIADEAAQKIAASVASVAPPDLELALANTLGDA